MEDVAVCFGITPLTVQRRLKLAKVSPVLFELFRQDKINLDQLMALAITDDHAAQERVWNSTPSYNRNPSGLRRLLLGREIDAATDPLAKFVAIPAYEAAGGVVVRDLFDAYVARPQEMRADFAQRSDRHRAVADYVAGMTDRFATREHRRLTGRDVFAAVQPD